MRAALEDSLVPPSSKKIFVLDTNVLLHDPNSILHFQEHDVVLPIVVIEEVDHFKKDQTEVGRNARTVSRLLDRLRTTGSLSRGVPLEGGGTLKVDVTFRDSSNVEHAISRQLDAGSGLFSGALTNGTRSGSAWLGPQFGVGLGAFALGLASNLYTRLVRRPSVVTLLPGLMVLVPGGLGFKGLEFIIQKQLVMGLDTAFQALFVAIALLTGLLLAQATVQPRTAL